MKAKHLLTTALIALVVIFAVNKVDALKKLVNS